MRSSDSPKYILFLAQSRRDPGLKSPVLAENEKKRHSFSKCCACAEKHMQLQKSYPRLPCFENSLIKLPLNESERTVTRRVLSDLNGSYKSAFNHSFTESVLKHCGTSEGIAVRETRTDKKGRGEICR